MTSSFRLALAAVVVALTVVFAGCSAPRDDQVFVYSARHYDSDTLLFDRFTALTGIEVRVLQGGSDELMERLEREGVASPADVLITVDAGRLWRAEQAGLLEAVDSALLHERIPAHLRHPEGLWYGFSQRLRVIFYNRERFDPAAVSRYEDLADPALAGQICIRSSNNIYNQSLLASLISHHGVEETEAWARGLVANLARPPQGGDTDQILGVAAGECDLAVANHYYYLRLRNSEDPARRAAADQVGIIFPNADDRGVHVNIGGAGVVRGAPNRANAVRFLEYLASDEAQAVFAGANFEYPVVPGVEMDEAIRAWGDVRLDSVSVGDLGRYNPEAVRLADRVGWR
ncbi:MAG: Fe(3+) ABC transporter substrate-binding protein [Gammaproteobacteria bacterium]|nr:MAG: Fe(3+) ABC transporter substrate-binding protein [Gammaproteobacteria bacterium]